MNQSIKTTVTAFCLVVGATLHAETEKEFGERVVKAWNSKQVSNILALHDDADSIEPSLKASRSSLIEFQIKKGFEKAEFSLSPYNALKKPAFGKNGMAYSMKDYTGNISVSFDDGRSGRIITPYTKSGKGVYALASPTIKKIDWQGPEMTTFQVIIRPDKNASYIPSSVLVLERYGRADFEVMDGSYSFRAHKIRSVIIPSTPESGTIKLEISQGMENIIFTQTIDTSKGAIITPDLKTP
jgi:hypothetical protein